MKHLATQEFKPRCRRATGALNQCRSEAMLAPMQRRLLMITWLLVACTQPPSPPEVAPSAADTAAAPAEVLEAAPWVELAPVGEGFTVQLPVAPARSTEPYVNPQGQRAEGIKYTVDDASVVFVLSVSPAAVQPGEADAQLALERMMATQTKQAGRTTRYDKVLEVPDAQAREAELELADGGTAARLRIRVYMRGAHMYQVLAIWPTAATTAPATVDRVFASYRLTGDVSKLGAPAFVWQEHTVPELGLVMSLPMKPTITTAEAETFLGKATVTSAMSITNAPMSAYSIERVALPGAYADKSDEALATLWKNARTNAAKGTAPKLVKESRGTLLGQAGPTLLLEEALPDGKARLGYLRLNIVRDGKKAKAILVASAWFMDDAVAAPLAERFFNGLREAP